MALEQTYIGKVLISFDQLLNSVLGGEPDETLSSRCHRMDGKKRYLGFIRVWIDTIFFWNAGHCAKAYTSGRTLRSIDPENR